MIDGSDPIIIFEDGCQVPKDARNGYAFVREDTLFMYNVTTNKVLKELQKYLEIFCEFAITYDHLYKIL